MKVRQLIEILQKADPDDLVVLSRDPEGNGHSPLGTYNLKSAFKDSEIGFRCIEDISEEDLEYGFCEDDVIHDGVPCIVLWPEY